MPEFKPRDADPEACNFTTALCIHQDGGITGDFFFFWWGDFYFLLFGLLKSSF